MNRGGVYAWLERSMQLPKGEGHVGRFNVEQCEQAIQLANAFMAVDAEDPLREERSRIRLGLESKFGKNRGRQARKWLGAAIGLETKALVHELTAQQCQTALEELQKLTARQP
jgi:hypothetical protein